MWLMYVDDSGDSGFWTPERGTKGTTDYYALSGLILSEHRWEEYLEKLKLLRREIKNDKHFKIPVTAELKGYWLTRSSLRKEYYPNIKGRKDAAELYKFLMVSFSNIFSTAKIINVFCDKKKLFSSSPQQQKEIDIFTLTWSRLIQRYHNFLRNIEDYDKDSLGIIISDNNNGGDLDKLIRKMRRYNPIPSKYSKSFYQDPTTTIIEDSFERHSKDSYFMQVADLIVYALYLHIRKKKRDLDLDKIFTLLENQFLTAATTNDPEGLGIVRIP